MNKKPKKIFACDFETTVYKGQERTDVWSSCLCELYTDVPILHGSINETYEYFESLHCDIEAYYHNLKFDGTFWLYYLLHELHYEQAYTKDENGNFISWIDNDDMRKRTFKYLIAKMGQWYTLTVRLNNGCYLTLKDSLKLFPFTLEEVGKGFGTQHRKLQMEYTGFRYPNCPITDEEKQYIFNDVLVLKEALEIFFTDNAKKLTIGSCCLSQYRKTVDKQDYKIWFPNLNEIELTDKYKYPTAETYIRKSYRGGWCYVVPEKANKIYTHGITADVNSLYPSMMSSESGNAYPIGKPKFWSGNFIPPEATKPNKYFFVRLRTRFYIKENKLPFIQIKNDMRYRSTEVLETSDYYDRKTQRYYRAIIRNGQTEEVIPEMVMTQTDYYLMLEHYNVEDFEILDGCYFFTLTGRELFDEYIEHYKQQKINSKGAKRTEAKLFLNNLYGKFATSPDSTFKVAFMKEDETLGFYDIVANDKKTLYIPIGSAITSYARNFTIRTAQKNYYGKDKRGFIYADTDSIHCDLDATELKGVPVHPTAFCHWKLESYWDKAIFVRQKTYIEHITHEDEQPIDNPYYNIKCAGMPKASKLLLEKSIEHITPAEIQQLETERKKTFTDVEKQFMLTPRELTDFKIDLVVPSKLVPKQIKGGVLLTETSFKLNKHL